MNIHSDFLDELEANAPTGRQINKNRRLKTHLPRRDQAFLHAQDDTRASFRFTYQAARFEGGWLLDSLGDFYEHQWISDVLGRVKGGKEASVYLCRAGPQIDAEFIAAKVYRPRMLRNLKNDSAYREGRVDLNESGHSLTKGGDLYAMRKRSAYGEELRHTSWIAYEYTALRTLHAAGADVPDAYTMNTNAILMGFVGNLNGCAPALSEVRLERAEARSLFERVLHNIDLMLANNIIHGDLSAYNILYWDGAIQLIDFPQVISPQGNSNAFSLFKRDVTRICEYFAKQGVKSDPGRLVAGLWDKYGQRQGPVIDPAMLDPEDELDRALWQKRDQGH